MGSNLFTYLDPASRLTFTMSARLFTCVCGFEPPSLASQKRHRKACHEWKDRPDPRGLMISRKRETMLQPRTPFHCEICEKQIDHHAASCPYSFGETTRREAVERAGLTSMEFYLFLKALKLRYPGGLGS